MQQDQDICTAKPWGWDLRGTFSQMPHWLPYGAKGAPSSPGIRQWQCLSFARGTRCLQEIMGQGYHYLHHGPLLEGLEKPFWSNPSWLLKHCGLQAAGQLSPANWFPPGCSCEQFGLQQLNIAALHRFVNSWLSALQNYRNSKREKQITWEEKCPLYNHLGRKIASKLWATQLDAPQDSALPVLRDHLGLLLLSQPHHHLPPAANSLWALSRSRLWHRGTPHLLSLAPSSPLFILTLLPSFSPNSFPLPFPSCFPPPANALPKTYFLLSRNMGVDPCNDVFTLIILFINQMSL